MSKSLGSRAAVLLIAAALTASACGDDDDTASDTGNTPSDTGDASNGTGDTSNDTSEASNDPVTIKFAFQPASITSCVKVTDERGVFAEHGITMEFPPAPVGPAAGSAQVMSGEVTAAATGYANIVQAIGSGLPIVITTGLDNDFDEDGQTSLAVVVPEDSGMTSLADLEGKVGVSSLAGTFEVLLRESMEIEGGDYSKVELVEVPFPNQVAAMQSGEVDALFGLQPFISILLNGGGFVSLGNPQAIAFEKPDATSAVIYMARDFVDENPDVVERFNAALAEGNEWCNSNPEEMRAAITRITGTPEAIIDATPLPVYNTGLDSTETEKWGELLVKWDVGDFDEAPSVDEVQWSGAPEK